MIGRSVLCVREGGSFGSELERSWCQAVQDRSPPATGAGKILSFPSSIFSPPFGCRETIQQKKVCAVFPSFNFPRYSQHPNGGYAEPTANTQAVYRYNDNSQALKTCLKADSVPAAHLSLTRVFK